MNPAVRPIFVIGLNRSGTKWLSNELARHPEIFAILNDKTGIRETNMFRGLGRKFDVRKFDDFVGMIQLWSTTDFFERTGVDKSRLFQLDPLPTDSYLLFAALMSMAAEQHGKRCWLQKGPPLAGLELAARFSDAFFVAIRRDMHDQIISHVKLSGNRSFLNLARATFAYVRDVRILGRFCRLTGCPIVEYSDLEKNKESLLAGLIDRVGLSPMAGSVTEGASLLPNSSFQSGESREQFLSAVQRGWISFWGGFFQWVPYPVMYWIARRAWMRLGPLVPGTFDNVRRKLPQLRDRFHDQVKTR